MPSPAFLSGGGISGETARAVDWSKTPLGPPETWSSALKTTVGTLLHSRHPMFLYWGPELIQFYNDGYLPSFGEGKHPKAMGQRGAECWEESWPIIGPQIDDVMLHGKASWNQDHLVPIRRNGRLEEVYWSYSYSPVYEEEKIAGVLVVVTETTKRILLERRGEFLRVLAASLVSARDPREVAAIARERFADAARDLPVVLFASRDASPFTGDIDATTIQAIAADVSSFDTPGHHKLTHPVATSVWPEPVSEVFVVPFGAARGAIVFGLSPRLPFDEAYAHFLFSIVETIGRASVRATAESERRNLLLQAPVATAIVIGPEHVFELANPLYTQMVGRELVGKTYLEAFPELKDTELPGILKNVYETGEPFVANEMRVPLVLGTDGVARDRFFTFNLQPIRNANDEVYGMMAVAYDITDQVLARRAVEETNRERAHLLAAAETSARAKDEFLAMLGHELRNPLAPILTALQLMELKGAGQLARERDIIQRQAQHLLHLVDDLLDVSRVAQGKIEIKKSRISLSDVVASAVETASPLLEAKSHTLNVDVPPGIEVDADPFRLSQVVANLLTNAARYTDAGGTIDITAAREGEEIVLRVRDNGIGIAANHIAHLFDAFFQGPQRKDRAEGGLGLGLALVQSLIELHGGRVSVKSDGPGKGSEFTLWLPPSGALRPSTPSEAKLKATQPPAPVRILMVDDNEDMAEVFAAILERVGYDVKTATDGPNALELAATFKPAIAILDIGLPVMDGYELASQLRERLGEEAPRLIAMSGYGQIEDRENSQRAGFQQHLVKPVDARTLVEAIARATAGSPTAGA